MSKCLNFNSRTKLNYHYAESSGFMNSEDRGERCLPKYPVTQASSIHKNLVFPATSAILNIVKHWNKNRLHAGASGGGAWAPPWARPP